MSVKYWDRVLNEWVIFPGTIGAPGKDAYLIAQENGYTGTREEFSYALTVIPDIVEYINNTDDTPTKGSENLVTSGGVRDALDELQQNLETQINETNQNLQNNVDRIEGNITEINENITNIEADLTDIYNNITRIDGEITNINQTINENITRIDGELNSLKKNVKDNVDRIDGEIDGIKKDVKENVSRIDGEINGLHDDVSRIDNSITNIEGDITEINQHIDEIVSNTIPEAILASIVDNLETDDGTKSLSARQGKILKEMIEKNTADLNQKIQSNTDAINALDLKVDQNVTNLTNLINNETDRAKKREDELESMINNNRSDIDSLLDQSGKTSHTLTIKRNSTVVLDSWNGSVEATAQINVPVSWLELNPTKEEIISILGYTPADEASLGVYVQGPAKAKDGDIVVFDGETGKLVKDSGHNLSEYATKAELSSYALKSDLSDFVNRSELRNYVTFSDLDGYATEQFVLEKLQDISDDDTWRPIKAGHTLLSSDGRDTLTIEGGTGITVSMTRDGTLTITNSAPAGDSFSLKIADDNTLGGIRTGYAGTTYTELPVYVEGSNGKAYVKITKNAITSALGYTPANESSIPYVPDTLPNPNYLYLYYTSSAYVNYNGSTRENVNLYQYFTPLLGTASHPGWPGIYVDLTTDNVVVETWHLTIYNPDAIIVVKKACKVTLSNTYKLVGMDDLPDGGVYKVYCAKLISPQHIFCNVAVYD